MNGKRTCGFLLGILFLLLTFVSIPAAAEFQDEIDRINRKIVLEKLAWEAGNTWITPLESLERRRLLGTWAPEQEGAGSPAAIHVRAGLAQSLNWASHYGRNYITKVRNQGACGSCWAFAVVAAAEAMYNIEKNRYSVQLAARTSFLPRIHTAHQGSTAFIPPTQIAALANPDISEQDLISCTTAGGCDGGYVSQAAQALKTQGIVSENCFSYEAEDLACNRCSNWKDVLSKIARWRWITTDTIDVPAIKTVLQDGPLVGYMHVYDDFYSYRSGVYQKTSGAVYEGGHAILMVGYDDGDNCWICKNSWGTNWGENGYFKIRRGNCETGTWVMQLDGVTINNRAPVLAAVGDQSVKEGGTITIQLSAQDPDNDEITYGASPLPTGATMNNTTGVLTWSPGYTQAGTYSIRFSVSDGLFEDYEDVRITVINVKKGKGKY